MDICTRQSLAEQILTQTGYLSKSIWLIQAAFLGMLFYCTLHVEADSVLMFLILLGPCLTLLLLFELFKSFGNSMWELETSCRYNLQHLFAIRLCLLSGIDLMTLVCALIAFRINGGALWEFALYLLLPFFLTAALCIQLLRKFGSRCSLFALSTVAILCSLLFPVLNNRIVSLQSAPITAVLEKCVCAATFAALGFLLYSMVALCTGKKADFPQSGESFI